MGVAVIGGLLTSTFLTLFVVPTAYITFDGTMARITGILRKMGFKFEDDSNSNGTSGNASSSSKKSGVDLSKPDVPGKGVEDIRHGKVIADSNDKEAR